MDAHLKAWILTIGNEIINGVITDTNRETISRELRSIGISVRGMSSVGDDPDEIADALAHAMDRAEVTIGSGGLGPTEDDKTSAAVASFLGVPMFSDNEQLGRIEERFRNWGRPMSPSNAKQALFPQGAIPLSNDYGTAPGFMIEKSGHVAMFFPGIPRELIGILRDKGIPAITERFGISRLIFKTKTLKVFGLSESRLGEILADVSLDEDDYHLAFLPRFPIIRLRLDVQAATDAEADEKLEAKQAVIQSRVGENIFSTDGISMEEVVLRLLEERKLTLGLAESITGGMIGEMLTKVPGSSVTFMGSIVSYSNDIKQRILNVSADTLGRYGAVSHQCAREMAIGARAATNAAMAISVTGIAGPDGGTREKPVGTFYLGMAAEKEVFSRRFLLPGTREWIRTLAAMQALDLVRRYLLGYRIYGTE